jgi:hypothetical protein
MKLQLSKTHSSLNGRNVRPYTMASVTDSAVMALARIGLHFDSATVSEQISQLARAGAFKATHVGDAAFTAPATTPSMPTPLQFLQTWLPGFVKIITAARKIDVAIGIKTVGSWEDAEIVQGIVEPAATVAEYGDFTNIPLASWNVNFERRSIVRGEMGIAVGLLEEGRAAAMRLNSAEEKRQGSAIALEQFRNAIGWYGWNSSAGTRTFGMLNDPYLLPYMTTSVEGGWAGPNATYLSITADIRMAIVMLRTQSQDQIDPEEVDLTLLLPTDRVDYLSITSDYGISVRDWLTQTYKRVRVVSAPEMGMSNDVAGTYENVFYLYADEIDSSIDGSSDGGETFAQLVQTKFMTFGVEKKAKSYVEDYGNATAGVLVKRPWAVVRVTGI